MSRLASDGKNGCKKTRRAMLNCHFSSSRIAELDLQDETTLPLTLERVRSQFLYHNAI
jgi:hypothetical protein